MNFTAKVKLKTLGKKSPGSHFNYKLFEAPSAPTSLMLFHIPVPLFILNILPQMPLFSPLPTTPSSFCLPNLYSFL